MQCLVSVNHLDEAVLVLAAGVPMIDLKDTSHGALAALDMADTQAIVAMLRTAHTTHRPLISATVGDDMIDLAHLDAAVTMRFALGVDVIKLPERIWQANACMPLWSDWRQQGFALTAVWSPAGLQSADNVMRHLQWLQQQGFQGVMLDTTDKTVCLLEAVSVELLTHFIHHARQLGLQVGLAGGMQLSHWPLLTCLAPDYVGFRGGLCVAAQRQASLLPEAVQQLMRYLTSHAPAGAELALSRPATLV